MANTNKKQQPLKRLSVKRFGGKLLSFLEDLPLVVLAILAGFGTWLIILLLLGQMSTSAAVTGLIMSTVFIGYPLLTILKNKKELRKGSAKESQFVAVAVLIFIASWTMFNMKFNGAHVYTNRDPATYAIGAAWLVDHENINIPRYEEILERKTQDTSAGFGINLYNSKELFAQGAHILPAFLGLIGRLVGKSLIFNFNVIFGATALLALFALARLIMKPRWAFVSVLALAGTLPFIYFSRDTYTEPLALTYIFSGLALAIEAFRRKNVFIWFVAGFTFGASALTRIDAYMSISFMLMFPFSVLLFSKKEERGESLKSVAVFIAGMIIPAVIGFLDVKYLSSGYFVSEFRRLKPVFILMGGVTFLGLTATLISWQTKLFSTLEKPTRMLRSTIIPLLILCFGAFLLVRPLIQTLYRPDTQLINGIVVEGIKRSYTEQTLYWVLWYTGPLVVVLAFITAALIVKKILTAKNYPERPIFIMLLSVIFGTATIYLLRPAIAPDQIWASRRFLPVAMPGFILFATYIISKIYEERTVYSDFIAKYSFKNTQVVSAVLATAMVLSPVVVTSPFLTTAPYAQIGGVLKTCAALPENSTVMWLGLARLEAIMSTRAFCDSESVGFYNKSQEFSEKPSQEDLSNYARKVRAQNRVPIVGVFDTNLNLANQGDVYQMVADASFVNIEPIAGTLPRREHTSQRFIHIGIVQNDGTVKALSALDTQ